MAVSVRGREAIMGKLRALERRIAAPGTLRVGFLENATYAATGTPVAAIAAIQEFGATIPREAGNVTIYRQVNKAGTGFNRKGKFAKAARSNFATVHEHGAYTITIPSRPFFRTMIAAKKAGWGKALALQLKATNNDAPKALARLGVGIAAQLTESIVRWTSPPNAASTVRKKGFNDPLIDSGFMSNRTGSEVV